MSNKKPRSIKRIKQDAKLIKKDTDYTYTEALNLAVKEQGFPYYQAYIRTLEPSETKYLYIQTEELIPKHVLRNELVKRSIDYAIFIPTETGLKKSILDATATIRDLFELENFHHFDKQLQGPEHKIKTSAFFVYPEDVNETTMSLYRPKTKNGDPRIWFKDLKGFASAGNTIAVAFYQNHPYLLNLSSVEDLPSFQNFLDKITKKRPIVEELLAKLKVLAKYPLTSAIQGDTAIGMAIEEALEISANSSKLPDYKGIELKSSRRKKAVTRNTLFAQVANWKISKLKSSKEILEKYGYERNNEFKLYCTISALKPNSQGLQFKIERDGDELHETHIKDGQVAVWLTSLLKERLLEKHTETFWIKAEAKKVDGQEFFYLHSVIHTKSPLTSQIIPLIEEGIITMDHLIKRNKKGGTAEKGPLFKILPSNIDLLFPEPIEYDLRD